MTAFRCCSVEHVVSATDDDFTTLLLSRACRTTPTPPVRLAKSVP